MSDDKTCLRVKLGAAEIQYEGDANFLRDEVMPTIGKMLDVIDARAELRRLQPTLQIEKSDDIPASKQHSKHQMVAPLSTNTIGTIMKVDSATDLAIAAAAHLILVKGIETISRQQILDEMKTAPSFFKKSFVNNHSNTMKTLMKADRLRLVSQDAYTLSHKERKALEKVLFNDERNVD